MFRWLSSLFSNRKLREEIKVREGMGLTGQTDPKLHELNCEQTDRLSDQDIQRLIRERTEQGKPVEKLLAAARDRGISATAGMSDAKLRQAIKDREAQGHTGRTDAATHALNVAQTSRLSNSEVSSLIQSRRAAGLPTGKLEAAARDRGID